MLHLSTDETEQMNKQVSKVFRPNFSFYA